MEVVHVVANAQRHLEVHLGLELKNQDQIQPRIITFLFRPTAKAHAPDHVISVPVRIFGSSGDGLLMQPHHLSEVERVDEFARAVEIGHEPAHQLLDHVFVGEDLLVGGVGLHGRDRNARKRGRPTDIDRSSRGESPIFA